MDLDDLQEKLGGLSRYQVAVIVLVSFLPFGTAFMSQIAVFFSAVPKFRCSIPIFDDSNQFPNFTEENITAILLPPTDSCKRYAYNISLCEASGTLNCLGDPVNETIDCDHGYKYDKTYYDETTVTEWNLVCDRVTLDTIANSAYFLGMFLGSALVGPILDWFGRRLALMIICISAIVTGLGVAFAPTLEAFILIRLFEAMVTLPCFIAYFTYVNEIAYVKWRMASGVYACMVTSLAHTVLPIFGYFLRNWRDLGLCVGLCCTPYLVIHFFLPRSPRWLLAKGLNDEAREIVERFARSNNRILTDSDWNNLVKNEQEKHEARGTDKKYTVRDLFRPPVMRFISFIIAYLWFTVCMVFYGLILNVGKLAGHPHLNSIFNAFVEIIAYIMFYIVVRLCGMRKSTSVAYFMSGICCLMAMLLSRFSNEDTTMLQASKWIAIFGKLFATLAFGLIFQYTAELYPTVTRGTALSMGSMSARLGALLTPATLQLQVIFGTLSVVGGIACIFLPETSKVDLTSSIDQAENWYRDEMTVIPKLLRASGKKYKSGKRQDIAEDNLML